ncbi:MOT12-like protein [Mya arenaria]|uniref:MOT12-like protein n=2 Tax=Mya arenaria TaxID=6604 RepID=A0ABY7F0Y7_MYAAR|nr:monocarboxylate transporter 12-like isoform X2 [Mya arenaria]XP_052821159.1 monocarboxylate transporter 12-like isoform X2 [Mya arenaria]XP_052821160.1 monocarboxylate transporter 12-like isoform X2 [Mya arenaria]WAR15242.1 MOT12-like protein [Mya arenaria]
MSASRKQRADDRYGWVVVAAAFTINFLADGIVFSSGVLLVEFLDDFEESHGLTAFIGAIQAGMMHLIGPLAAALMERLGAQIVTVVGAVLTCIGLAASFPASTVAHLTITMGVIGGTGIGLMFLPPGALVVQYFTERRALANGIAVCGSGVGTFVFNHVMHLLISEYTWRGAVLVAAGAALNGAVFGLLLRPAPRSEALPGAAVTSDEKAVKIDEYRYSSDTIKQSVEKEMNIEITMLKKTYLPLEYSKPNKIQDETYPEHSDSGMSSLVIDINGSGHDVSRQCESETKLTPTPGTLKVIWTTMLSAVAAVFPRELLKNRRLLMFMAFTFVFNLAFVIPFSLVPDEAISAGLSKYQATWLVSSIGITNIVSRIIMGWIGDRDGVNRPAMLVAMVALAGLAIAAVPFLPTFETKLCSTAAIGIFLGGFVMLFAVVLTDMFGDDVISRSIGLAYFTEGIACFVAVPKGGWLFDVTGNYQVTFLVAGGECLLAAALLVVAISLHRNSYTVDSLKATNRKISWGRFLPMTSIEEAS